MTTIEQRHRIAWFHTHGYDVRPVDRLAHGVIVAAMPRKLTAGVMFVRLYPDGTYMPAQYDQHLHRKAQAA